MDKFISRRTLLGAGTTLAAGAMLPAWAQGTPTLRFAAVFSDKDIRAEMMKMCRRGRFSPRPICSATRPT